MKVSNKEAYFLSLYGLIPKSLKEEMEPILVTKFSKELQKFRYRGQMVRQRSAKS